MTTEAWTMMGLGILVVFAVLAILYVAFELLHVIVSKFSKKQSE